MKTLFTALLLTTLAAPVLALDLPMFAASGVTSQDLLFPAAEGIDRRSGRCPSRTAKLIAGEGSACGGV